MDQGTDLDRGLSPLRWADPVAFCAIAVVVLRVVYACVQVVSSLQAGAGAPVAPVLRRAAVSAADPLTIVVAGALILVCMVGRTPRAAAVSLFALLACGTAVVMACAAAVAGGIVSGAGLGLGGFLVDLAIPALTVGVIAKAWLAQRRPAADRGRSRQQEAAGAEAAAPAIGTGPADRTDVEAPPVTAPAWEPDIAAGAVWHSAGSAASGAAAAAWGRPGEVGSWEPLPRPDSEEADDAPQLPHRPHKPQQ